MNNIRNINEILRKLQIIKKIKIKKLDQLYKL